MLVIGIDNKDDLIKLINQEPLIEINSSLEGMTSMNKIINSYFGIGLSNGNMQLSKGIPFDVLSMILVNELICSGEKNILIADTHAKHNGIDKNSINNFAEFYENSIYKILNNLGFNNWKIQKASDIDQTNEYKLILNSINETNEYIKRQLTDMAWFNQEKDINLKLGWELNGTKNSDEKAFDQNFIKQFGNVLNFIYVTSGKTFDPKKLRSPPYFCGDITSRILLHENENVHNKLIDAQNNFGKEATRPYEKYLNQIVRLYNKTVEKTEGELNQRIQQVIYKCMK